MIGSLLIYRPTYPHPLVEEIERAPTAEELHTLVGGYIELVPQFNTIIHKGTKRACAVFCNEHGKINGLPVNRQATMLWNIALERNGITRNPDYLVGPIVVVIGDRELMSDL